MKLKTLLLTTALVTSSAFADAPAPHSKSTSNQFEAFYGKIEAGISKASTIKFADGNKANYKNSFAGGIGGGYKFNEFFRSELMFQGRNIKVKSDTKSGVTTKSKSKLRSYSVMLNGYLDAHNNTIFTPYLMAGIGVGRIKYKGHKAVTGSNWNVGLGAQAKVHEQISVDLGYRYVMLAKIKDTKKHLATNEVVAGLIWHL